MGTAQLITTTDMSAHGPHKPSKDSTQVTDELLDVDTSLRQDRARQFNPYQYLPLTRSDQIRLLRLHGRPGEVPRADQGPLLECEIIHVSLRPNNICEYDYMAISYVWGDPSQHDSVFPIGDRCLTISRSLHGALNTLRALHGTQDLLVWADQICIDQSNLAERGHQVELMGHIFASAYRTAVWLGEPDDTTRTAFAFMKRLENGPLSSNKSRDWYYKKDWEQALKVLRVIGLSRDDVESGTLAVEEISNNVWFTRLWTFQEFAVSKSITFHSGSYHCTHTAMFTAFYLTRLLRDSRTTGLYHASVLERYMRLYRTKRRCKLSRLLSDVSDSQYACIAPHDRVYALLALQDGSSKITVNYDTPLQTFLQETARSILWAEQNLQILCRRRTGKIAGLPSWAPDWTTVTYDWSVEERYKPKLPFASSKGRSWEPAEPYAGVLAARGRAVARVRKVFAHKFSDFSSTDLEPFLGVSTLLPELAAELTTTLIAEARLAPHRVEHWVNWLIATTLTCGRFRDPAGRAPVLAGPPAHIAKHIAAAAVSDRRTVGKCKGRRVALLDAPRTLCERAAATHPQAALRLYDGGEKDGQAVETAEHGEHDDQDDDLRPSPATVALLALLPDYARNGDVVCVLHGSATPLVLRPSNEHDGLPLYCCLGECFVHGIMYGEAVNWEERGGDEFGIV